jgi:hypothetical protein
MAKLERLVEEGEQFLAKLKPGSSMRLTRKKQQEIDAALAKVITREVASEDLFRHCFPDKVLADEYRRKLSTKDPDEASTAES